LLVVVVEAELQGSLQTPLLDLVAELVDGFRLL
jgi:hypothetical protein